MSSFARGQLEKYGWKEGKGLGKHEHGIATALRPKLKFDTRGVGHDPGKEFTNDWWNLAFNQAAKNISVINSEDGVVVNSKASRKKKRKRNPSPSSYGSNFVKAATLLSNGEVELEEKVNGNSDVDDTSECSYVPRISEEELVAKCGGRTAHKAARHGCKLNGKLLRLQRQEAALLQNPSGLPANSSLLDPGLVPSDKKRKKIKVKSYTDTLAISPSFEEKLDSSSRSGTKRKKKKA